MNTASAGEPVCSLGEESSLHSFDIRQPGIGDAAGMTGTRILEARLRRELVGCVFIPLRLLRLVVRYEPRVIRGSFTERKAITRRIDVRRYAAQKRAAPAVHHAKWQGTGSPSGENGSLNPARRQEPCNATFWRLAEVIPAGQDLMTRSHNGVNRFSVGRAGDLVYRGQARFHDAMANLALNAVRHSPIGNPWVPGQALVLTRSGLRSSRTGAGVQGVASHAGGPG